MPTLRPAKPVSIVPGFRPPPLSKRDAIICIALVVLTFVVFSPALSADFVRWDDPQFVTENPNVHGITPAHLAWMFTQPRGGHFHPLTWLSWAIDYEVWGGLKPWGFHFTSILLHAANAVLVYMLLRRIVALCDRSATGPLISGGSLAMSAGLGAAVFALHPLRAESVAWVTERRDVLSALFLLASAIFYLRSARPGESALVDRRAYAVSILFLVLSCLSKGWGMVFFSVLLVLDWYPLRRISLDPRTWLSPASLRALAQKVPFVVIGIATACTAAYASHESLAVKTLEQWGVRERAVQAAYGLWFYTRATFFPEGLSPLYQLPVRIDPWEPRFIAAYAFIAIALAAVLLLRRRFPGLSAAGAIYLIVLAPVLGLLQSGEQFVADRYSYLASLVFSALIAGGMYQLLSRFDQREQVEQARHPLRLLLLAASGIAVCTLSVLTFVQSAIWTSTESLWAHAIVSSRGSQVLVNYGEELNRLGRKQEGAEAIAAAAALNPTDGRAWFDLGNHLKETGHSAEAAEAFAHAAKYLPQAYMAYVNLGNVYWKDLKRPQEALAAYRAAVADIEKGGRRPLSAGPYITLGVALRDSGDLAGGKAMLTRALEFPETRASAEKELAILGQMSVPPQDKRP